MVAAPRGDLRLYLAQVPDPRGRKGTRHDFVAILTAAACAILQGCRGYAAIAQWLDEQPLDFLHSLGFTRWPPTESGVRKLLARVDGAAFERAVEGWTQEVTGELSTADAGDDGLRPTDLDGKSLRGSCHRIEGTVLPLNTPSRTTW